MVLRESRDAEPADALARASTEPSHGPPRVAEPKTLWVRLSKVCGNGGGVWSAGAWGSYGRDAFFSVWC